MEVSLRDYLAAHAPWPPHPWFVPDVPKRPVEPPQYPDDDVLHALLLADRTPHLDDDCFGWEEISHVKESLDDWRKDACWNIEEQFGDLALWCDAWHSFFKEIKVYGESVRKAELVQWPYAWADALIEERERF